MDTSSRHERPAPCPTPEQQHPAPTAFAAEAGLLARIRELEGRQHHLHCLLDSARDAVLEMNTTGIITSWNTSAEQMLGWSAAEAIGSRMCELIVPPQHQAGHEAGFAMYLETGRTRTIKRLMEIEALHRSGALVAIELSIFTMLVDGTLSFGAFIRDISSRRETEQAMRQSEERYRAVIENADEGMIVIQNEKVAYANARAADIASISLEEIRQIGFLHRIYPDDHQLVLERQRRRLAGENVPSRHELRPLMPDGSVRWIGISVTLVPWNGSPAILTFFRTSASAEHWKKSCTARCKSGKRFLKIHWRASRF